MGLLVIAAKITGETLADLTLHDPMLEISFEMEEAHLALANWARDHLGPDARTSLDGLQPSEVAQKLISKQIDGVAAHIEVYDSNPVPDTKGLYGFGVFADDRAVRVFASGTMDQDNWESIDADAMMFVEDILTGNGAYYLEGVSFDSEGRLTRDPTVSEELSI